MAKSFTKHISESLTRLMSLRRSVFLVLLEGDNLEIEASELSALVTAAGHYPIVVQQQGAGSAHESVPRDSKSVVIVLTLPDLPDERTATFCKNVADDFRNNRVGLLFPDGSVAQESLPIHAVFVVTTKRVMRLWSRQPSFARVIDYYTTIRIDDPI